MKKEGNDEFNKPMNTQKWLIISSLFLALGIIVYGGIKLKWKLDETAAVLSGFQ